MDEQNMEKRGGKRCYVGKNYYSDWPDSNVYEAFSFGISRRIPRLTVLSTDLGLRELKGVILELSQMVKDHDILIRHLEDRMNHLASQMRSEMIVKEKVSLMKNFTPSLRNFDEEDIEKNIEEILFKESLEGNLLNNIFESSEGLEEVCHVVTGVGSNHYQPKKLDLILRIEKLLHHNP
ncbi:hypothetical protein HAX54_046138 [Datura stramonium]|uniref:Uncharacterized protein n=1 Tax=Datura stramonium TaxID=4076 RepID=A0ABS8WKB7_DATST|nr:hypothetical protein [Datura stramonium]